MPIPISAFYLARPIYGGWPVFTAHACLKYEWPLYKIGNKTETKLRPFGYDVGYQNISPGDVQKLGTLGKLLITAIDKTCYEYLDIFPDGTYIVIHDPTEVKPNAAGPLLEHLKRFRILTIRQSVSEYLKKTYALKSKFLLHPFYPFPFQKAPNPQKAVSISRVDFDKHTDIILDANKQLDSSSSIDIHGSINRQYVFFQLKKYPFSKYYKGSFERSFEELGDILRDAKYVVDMSVIKNDGGGSQYTFLEAIATGCALILNAKWIEGHATHFVDGKNCFVVKDGDELATLLKSDPSVNNITKAAKKILKPHIDVDWPSALSRM